MSGPYFIPIPAAGVAAERVAEGLNVATRVTIVWGLSITFVLGVTVLFSGLAAWRVVRME